jgi:hypothetical protein
MRIARSLSSLALLAFLATAGASLGGCQSVYYETMEVFGSEKRDLLRSELKGMVSDQEDADGAVSDIDGRMDEIETVAADLFEEWEGEVAEIQTANLKAKSKKLLRETKAKYERMHASLLETRGSMDPVLAVLKDHVLFLKANLNAAAIGSIGDEMKNIEAEIEDLKKSIQQSIAEAQRFIEAMPQ